MITQLEVRNFRSILSTDALFSPSGLNVLIGANGSGKTNFVRALEFLDSIATYGFDTATSAMGGFEAIVPKRLGWHYRQAQPTRVTQRQTILPPPNYLSDWPAPAVTYSVEFSWRSMSRSRIDFEELVFTDPLLIGRCLRCPPTEKERLAHHPEMPQPGFPRSTLRIRREGSDVPTYHLEADGAESYLDDYTTWFGIPNERAGGKVFNSIQEFSTYLQSYTAQRLDPDFSRLRPSDQPVSMIEQTGLFPTENSIEFGLFRHTLANAKRYDFTLATLRNEQAASSSISIGPDGTNFPGAVKEVDRGRARQRIRATLAAIAPHIDNFFVKRLATGKQYVRFREHHTDRSVESWNTSDGTLRLVAFLAALETHPPGATLIMEEPERGLHPWALPHLIKHIREAIEERGLQVVLTSHSDHLLDSVRPEEVWICHRDPRAGTQLKQLRDFVDVDNIEPGEIGRLWSKGLIGGVPGYADAE